MVSKLALGGVLGGIVMFMWLGLSWAVMPFHRAALKELPKSSAMVSFGTVGMTHGIYYSGEPHKGSTAAEIPLMVYLPGGYPPMQIVMIKGLLLSIFALCLCTGAVVALAGPMTFGNFFFFPLQWVLPDVLDQLIGWTLAGLVIAAFTKPAASLELEPRRATG
jgi:hypothetical protein